MFLPETLGSSFLAGFWLDAAEKTGTVKVMQDRDALLKIQQQNELRAKIAVLATPQFWNYTGEKNGWNKETEGDKKEKNLGDSGFCTNTDCKSSLCKTHCKNDSTDVVPQIVTEREKGEKNERIGQKDSEKDKKERLRRNL